jgi:predicted metal-dependent phosphoesterase TrpH
MSASQPQPPLDGRCDLHIHTIFSDGILTPETVVRKAKEQGLVAISISDHDAVGGIDPAIRAGDNLGIEVVPGIEMSCVRGTKDVHMLGYFIDQHDAVLLAFLAKVQAKRLERARKIVTKLGEQGVKIDVNRVLQIAGGGALGRPHIAQALIEAGAARNTEDAFARLIGYDSPAYIPKMEISPLEAVSMIREHGGIAVAAHPGTCDDEKLIGDLIAAGLQGIEVYHPDHDNAASRRYLEIARKNGLFVTGGSDCHGGRNNGKIHIGDVTVPYAYLLEIKKALGRQ